MNRTRLWISSGWIFVLMQATVACGSESNNRSDSLGLGGALSLVGGSSAQTSTVVQAGTSSSVGGASVQPSSGQAAGGDTTTVVAGSGGAGGNSAMSTGGAITGGTPNAAGSAATLAGGSGGTTQETAPGGGAAGGNSAMSTGGAITGGTPNAAGSTAVSAGGSGGTTQTTAIPSCTEGTYDHDLEPSTACVAWTVCVPGQRVLSSGSSTQDRTCSACADGAFSVAENAASCRAWSDCPAGTFVSNAPSKTTDRACADCGSGTFTASANQSLCETHVPCAPGTVQASAGTSTSNPTCSPCAPGNYCAGATAPSESCADGMWDHDQTAATACVAKRSCAAKEYLVSEGDAVTDRTCAPACTGMQCGTDHGIACGTCPNSGPCDTETNKCVPQWSLISVDYSDRMMIGAKNYGDTCAHLVTEDYDIVWELVTCCDVGPCQQPIDNAQWTTDEFKPGARVMLCHGNNYSICSNIVTITE